MTSLSRLETCISRIEQAAFFLGYCVPPPSSPPNAIVSMASDEPPLKKQRAEGEAAPVEVAPVGEMVIEGENGREEKEDDAESGEESAVIVQGDGLRPAQTAALHDAISALKSVDTFSCGGRFVLNDADRPARLRYDNGQGESSLFDFGGIANLPVADMVRSYVKPAPLNAGQDRADHVGNDFAVNFRMGISTSMTTKQTDDLTFLDQIRVRCKDVFNVPSVNLRRRHLRVYSKGGFSKGSMMMPRVPQRTIGTLIVCLPSLHTGGKLVISHLKGRISFNFSERSGSRETVQWAAFYSDCEYEIKKVRSGHQVLVMYDILVEKDAILPDLTNAKRQIYKQAASATHATADTMTLRRSEGIQALVDGVCNVMETQPAVGLFTWYAYTLAGLNAAPLTLKGLDRHLYEALLPNFNIVLIPVVVRLYEDAVSDYVRVAAFSREDIEYMEGVADAPSHPDLEQFKAAIPFLQRPDIETFEFNANDEVEKTYFYCAMIILQKAGEDEDGA